MLIHNTRGKLWFILNTTTLPFQWGAIICFLNACRKSVGMAAAHGARDGLSRGKGAPTSAEFPWALRRRLAWAGTLVRGRTRAPLHAYSVVTFNRMRGVLPWCPQELTWSLEPLLCPEKTIRDSLSWCEAVAPKAQLSLEPHTTSFSFPIAGTRYNRELLTP